jgi:hypothetical protein
MLDFIVGQIVSYLEDRGIAALSWTLERVPAGVMLFSVFGALSAWLIGAGMREWWRSRQDSNLRPPR